MEDNSARGVERALTILEAIAERDNGMSNAEISRRLEIPKSSASYILRALERRGYLRRDGETSKYRLGLKALNLSRGALDGLDIRRVALPEMRRLMERSHLTSHLAVLDHGEAVYVEKVDAPGFVKMNTWVGRHMPIHCTSVGKALVAWLPEAEVKALLKEHGMRRRTSKTIVVCGRYLQELARVREQGYAVDDEENNYGVRCVAAPIFDSLNRVVASVGVSGTITQNDVDHLPKVAELVKEAARKASQQMGGQTTGPRGSRIEDRG
jgi:IclR family transcriptional regulator, KDG regulon repressor